MFCCLCLTSSGAVISVTSSGVFTKALCLSSALGSTLGAGLVTGLAIALGSGLGTTLGSGLGTALGAGLGSRLGAGLGSCLGAELGSCLGAGLRSRLGARLGSCLGAGLGSRLVARLGSRLGSGLWSRLGAGLGSRLGAGLGSRFIDCLASTLLTTFLSSLASCLLSVIDVGCSGAGSLALALCSGALCSGVTALEDTLEAGGGGSSSSVEEIRLVLTGAGAGSAALVSKSIFCRGLISRSEPCSALVFCQLSDRDGPFVLGTPGSSMFGTESRAELGDGVEGRLLCLLPGRLPPLLLLPPPRLLLSPFQLPGPRRLGSRAAEVVGLGDGVRAGLMLGFRLSISCMKGLSGGMISSARSDSCMSVSAFSLLSAISCNARFFRYSGPERRIQYKKKLYYISQTLYFGLSFLYSSQYLRLPYDNIMALELLVC